MCNDIVVVGWARTMHFCRGESITSALHCRCSSAMATFVTLQSQLKRMSVPSMNHCTRKLSQIPNGTCVNVNKERKRDSWIQMNILSYLFWHRMKNVIIVVVVLGLFALHLDSLVHPILSRNRFNSMQSVINPWLVRSTYNSTRWGIICESMTNGYCYCYSY